MNRLTPAQYAATAAKLDKINQRAAKRGFTGRFTLDATPVIWWAFIGPQGEDGSEYAISDTATAPESQWVQGPRGEIIPGYWVRRDGFDVELSGDAPCYEGWIFAARLDWDGAGCGELIVSTAPGFDGTIDRTALVEDYCAHCGKTRRRKATYVVVNSETGEQTQVGSTCLKDFLGHDARIVWLDPADIASQLEEDDWGAARGDDSWDTLEVLTLAWAATRAWGFIRSNEPGATKDQVRTLLTGCGKIDEGDIRDLNAHLAEARTRAVELREWIATGMEGSSDYVLNLKAAARAPRCSPLTLGLLASAPAAMFRATEERAQRTEIPSEWVGKPGERLVITAELVSVRWFDGVYGTRAKYLLRDAAGNVFVWWTNTEALGDETGATFTIRATVKSHDTYKETKETILTRCTVLQPAASAA